MFDVYIPMDRRQALGKGETLPDRAQGSVLFVDISGFTPLTEALARELGPHRGAEELTQQLNAVYGALIAELHRYGGSVVGFSGDAITCWLDDDDGQRALTCALAMQDAMDLFEKVETPAGTVVSMGVKVGAATGPVRRFLVGEPHIQRLEVLAGATLDRVAQAGRMAKRGEVVAGAQMLVQRGDGVLVEGWRSGPAGGRFAVVTGLAQPAQPSPWPDAPPVDDDVAREWVLPPIYQRLREGQGEFLAELRPAVALFIKFSGLDYDGDDDAGAKLDAYIRWVQSVVLSYGGNLLDLTMGDKGSYLYANFGAPVAHEDDSARAVAAALQLRSPPRELGFIGGVQMGISQGQMRAGACGGQTRRTYGVLGNEANIAARLMDQAEPGQILVSAQVKKAAADRYEFQGLESVPLKGVSEPLPVFAVLSRRLGARRDTTEKRSPAPMVGRLAERTILAERLQGLREGRPGGLVIIEGEAGIGKSRLALDLLEQAQAAGVQSLLGWADAIERTTPYHAWGPIFIQLLGPDLLADSAERQRQRVLARLQDEPDLLAQMPLINAVLPLDWPDNDVTRQLKGEGRANKTNDFLIHLLQKKVTTPLLLILEDAHWLDSASWALTRLVSLDIQPLLLVIVTRPIAEPLPKEYRQFLARPDLTHLRLENLPRDDTLALVRARLGVKELPDVVATLIHERAEGNPFFSEELAYTLREAGLIQIGGGACRVAREAGDLDLIEFPDTVQGVVAGRIDRLTPAEQLVLKVASVIGRVFFFRTLYDVHPIETDKLHLETYLAHLERLDITPLETPRPDLSYIFKHIITQEVAYNLMLFAQRQQLHKIVAEWYERAYADELAPYYPVLAHHWSKAGTIQKAMGYLAQAGTRAWRSGAYHEAIDFLSQVLALDAQLDRRHDRLQRARWLYQLGDAYYCVGQMPESRQHLRQALVLTGHAYPTSRGALIRDLLKQLVRQAGHRLIPERAVVRRQTGDRMARLSTALQAHQPLAMIAYISNEKIPLLYITLRALNLAEWAGAAARAEQAVSYAGMGVIAGTLRLRRLAEVYARRVAATTQQLDDLDAKAFAVQMLGAYALGQAKFEQAQTYLDHARQLAEQAGNIRRWEEATISFANAFNYQGYWSTAASLYTELYPTAVRQGDVEALSWILTNQAYIALRQGQFGQALSLVEQSKSQSLWCLGVRTLSHLYQGTLQLAQQYAERIMGRISESSPSVVHVMLAYVGAAEFYLTQWETCRSTDHRQLAQAALKCMQQYARAFDLGKPYIWAYRSWYCWLAGRPRQACKAGEKAIRMAQQLDMPYNEGMAHYHLGRFLRPSDSSRHQHLSRAAAIFERLGASWDAERAREALVCT